MTDKITKKILLHLPLYEIRSNTVQDEAKPANKQSVSVTGSLKMNYDYYMGSSVLFSGSQSITVSNILPGNSNSFTALLWFNVDKMQSAQATLLAINGKAIDNNIALSWDAGKLSISWGGQKFNLEQQQSVDRWHFVAVVAQKDATVKLYLNSVIHETSLQAAFTGGEAEDNAALNLLIGSGFKENNCFYGKMAQVKLFQGTLSADELKQEMTISQVANATFKSTYPIDFKINTVDNGAENPVLYIAEPGSAHKLKLDIINVTGTTILLGKVDAPTERKYHFQLRFKANILAQSVLDGLNNLKAGAWQFSSGTDHVLHEDWISIAATEIDAPLNGLLVVYLDKVIATPMGGARNTLVQVKYDNLRYTDSKEPLLGAVTRHLDIISHFGVRNVPFEAWIDGSATILNDGKSGNSFSLKIRSAVKDKIVFSSLAGNNEKKSKFIMYFREGDVIGKDIPVCTFVGDTFTANTVNTAAKWLQTFECQKAKELGHLEEFHIDITNFYTRFRTGIVMLYIEYNNIPGYWDGVIQVALNFGSIAIRENSIGINTYPEKADQQKPFNIDVKGALSIIKDTVKDRITLLNSGGGWLKIGQNDIKNNNDTGGLATSGRIKDKAGYVMPVGSIIAYGGFGDMPPEGWLFCDGRTPITDARFTELRAVLRNKDGVEMTTTPDLEDKFILQKNAASDLHKSGGENEIRLRTEHMPSHKHSVSIQDSDVTVASDNLKVLDRAAEINRYIGDGSKRAGVYPGDYVCSLPPATDIKLHSHGHHITEHPVGNNAAYTHIPKHYVLRYIIKY